MATEIVRRPRIESKPSWQQECDLTSKSLALFRDPDPDKKARLAGLFGDMGFTPNDGWETIQRFLTICWYQGPIIRRISPPLQPLLTQVEETFPDKKKKSDEIISQMKAVLDPTPLKVKRSQR